MFTRAPCRVTITYVCNNKQCEKVRKSFTCNKSPRELEPLEDSSVFLEKAIFRIPGLRRSDLSQSSNRKRRVTVFSWHKECKPVIVSIRYIPKGKLRMLHNVAAGPRVGRGLECTRGRFNLDPGRADLASSAWV